MVSGLPVDFDATLAWSAAITERTCRASSHVQRTARFKVAGIVSGGKHNESLAATGLRGMARSTLAAASNQRCYAARHGYAYNRLIHNFLNKSECIACSEALRRSGRHPTKVKPLNGMWNKQFNLKYALDLAPMGTWVLWVDGDVLFMNPNLRVEEVLRQARKDTARQPAAVEGEGEVLRHRHHSSANTSLVATQCDVVLSSHLNAGVLVVRKSCWAMRFIDYWLAHRDWCAYSPLRDNGPMVLALAAAMRGEIREDTPPPAYVPVPPRMETEHRALCGERFNLSGLSYAGSRVCVTRGGFANRTASTSATRGFNSPWLPGDLLAHFLGSVYGEVRGLFAYPSPIPYSNPILNPSPNPNPNSNPDPDQVRACFLRFVASARLMDQRCACHPSGLPCDTASGAGSPSGLQNCHPSTTWRSWAPPSAVYSKGLSTY